MIKPCRHVIIGDGVTAAEFAKTASLCAGDQLTIIGPNAYQLGRGLAYMDFPLDAPWRHSYLLNSPNSAVDEGFTEWFAQHWFDLKPLLEQSNPRWLEFGAEHIAADDFGALFAPRSIFGSYLNALANAALDNHTANGVLVQRRSSIATDIALVGEEFLITLVSGEKITADRVNVATGGPSVQRFGSDSGETAFTTLYGNESQIAKMVVPGQTVTCLGANAAMLDVLQFLQTQMDEADIRLQVISASGRLPKPLILQRPRKDPVQPRITGVFTTADTLLSLIDEQVTAFRGQGATMAELRSGFYAWAHATDLNVLLPNSEEQRIFTAQLDGRFRRGTHDSIATFQRLVANGQIEMIKGEISRVYARGAGDIEISVKGADGVLQKMVVPLTINTSGPGPQRAFDLLTTGMIQNGWLDFNRKTLEIKVGSALDTKIENLRYLSPAVTHVGEHRLPFPLYDIVKLRSLVQNSQGLLA